VRITSVTGQRVCTRIEISRTISERSCRDDIGRVHMNVPFLSANLMVVPVQFGPPDASADGG
jgi:hypothetical protein